MNLELENTLVANYPVIYQLLEPRLPDGTRFECGDGWYRIIDQLSRNLESEAQVSGLQVVCVKEKLGGLRVYLRGDVPDRARDWVTAAACLSGRTCELCSQPATLRKHQYGGARRTLCSTCAAARGYVFERSQDGFSTNNLRMNCHATTPRTY